MSYYYTLKFIHIISSTLLFGTGLGSAFYFWRANISGNHEAMLFAARNVVIADWAFTTPAVVIQPLTGIMLMQTLNLPFSTNWILISLVLYVLIGLCWLPVVWLQMIMHRQLKIALLRKENLPALYYKYYRIWFFLGWPAFTSVILIFYLMVFKRVPI